MAGWIKMPFGREVGLGPGDTVLDGDPSPSKGGAQAPTFRPMYCDQTAGNMKMPLGTEVGLGPGLIVLDGDPSAPQRDTAPSNFRPISIVAKRSPISATAEQGFR